MKVKLIRKENPQERTEYKYYPIPVNEGTIRLEDIAKQLTARSSLSYGDIFSSLQNCLEFIPFLLTMGKSVNLGNFGTLRVSISSEGVEDPEDFHPSLIKKKRIIFTPGKSFKKEISETSIETVKD